MIKKEFKFSSSTGVCQIYACEYMPDDNIVNAVFVVHHGMAEHQQRYFDFFEYLTSQGYAVFMHDMANHGKSNQNYDDSGYFGDENGYKALIKDFKILFDKAKTEFPDKKIIIMGHSMGSFIARCFTAQYPNAGFYAAVYMGTGGKNPLAGIGSAVSSAISKYKGNKYKSKFLDKLTFGSYNNKFEKRTNFDWLTRDNETVDKYLADNYCGFLFTAKGMNDLVQLNIMANSNEWYEKVPKELPILIISGAMDPVGNYGKGLYEIKEKLEATGHKKTKLMLYDGARHEVLNEINKKTVYEDINSFVKNNVLGD
ncbi:MAG: alpha/beta hydrolase [Clostridiales bacterium]|nr:alpha/beta hydrolase [Clostridiales bacterium]